MKIYEKLKNTQISLAKKLTQFFGTEQGLKEQRLMEAYKRLFKTEDGELVLYDMAKTSGFLSDNQYKSDIEMAYNEGKRAVFVELMHKAKLDTRVAIVLHSKYYNSYGE